MSIINGLILNGGKSSRMGVDKGSIAYHGKPQREFLSDLLKVFCESVYLSCKSREAAIDESHSVIVDQFDIDSPLNGILSAFKTNPKSSWLVVAVDMPLIDRPTIQYLIDHRDTCKAATCFFDSDGKLPEPLLTIWEPAAFPLLLKFFEAGNISPRQFLIDHDVNLISVLDKRVLLNINSPGDLKKIPSV